MTLLLDLQSLTGLPLACKNKITAFCLAFYKFNTDPFCLFLGLPNHEVKHHLNPVSLMGAGRSRVESGT